MNWVWSRDTSDLKLGTRDYSARRLPVLDLVCPVAVNWMWSTDLKTGYQLLLCQAPGVIGSVLGLVCPVPVKCMRSSHISDSKLSTSDYSAMVSEGKCWDWFARCLYNGWSGNDESANSISVWQLVNMILVARSLRYTLPVARGNMIGNAAATVLGSLPYGK